MAYETGRKELDYWTPSESDITQAIPAIKAFLTKQAPSIANRLSQYRCQYFGIIVGDKKRIYCNFFPKDDLWSDWDWKTDPLSVDDGGDWYFQLEYEIESKQCLNLQINGEA